MDLFCQRDVSIIKALDIYCQIASQKSSLNLYTPHKQYISI